MRRDVGGHADGDARRAVDQQVGNAGGQDDRFDARAVVIGAFADGPLVDLGQQFAADGCEAALGVAHGRGGVAVERAEVAAAVDQRMPHGEGLGHADQGVVDGGVAVGVVIAHDVADDLGALSVAGVGGESLLPHRVEDAALHGFESVAYVGQSPAGDDGECVVEIALACGGVQGDGVGAEVVVAVVVAVRVSAGGRHGFGSVAVEEAGVVGVTVSGRGGGFAWV